MRNGQTTCDFQVAGPAGMPIALHSIAIKAWATFSKSFSLGSFK
jgi:hypothetical protein